MRNPYDELLRLMEHEAARDREVFWRFVHAAAPEKFWEPHADVYETQDALKLKVELAGVHHEEIQVELSGDGRAVTIRGLRVEGGPDIGKRIVFHQMEIYTGPFERTFLLPPDVEVSRTGVEAVYQDGFLVVTLPKRKRVEVIRTRVEIRE